MANQSPEIDQWIQMGVAAIKQGDLYKARQMLNKARELNPANTTALLWLTRTTEDPVERKTYLEQVLALEPGHERARQALDAVLIQIQKIAAPPEPLPFELDASNESILPEVGDLIAPGAEDLTANLRAGKTTGSLGRCPRCGAALTAEPGKTYCVHCGYGMGDDAASRRLDAVPAAPARPWKQTETALRCQTCESEYIPAPNAAKDAPCPVCLNKLIEAASGRVRVLPLPDVWFPMVLEEARAAISLEDLLIKERRLVRGKPLYSRPRPLMLPLWLFNGETQVEAGGKTTSGTYRDVLIHPIAVFEPALLRRADEVDFTKATPMDASANPRVTVMLPTLPLDNAIVEARGIMLSNARSKARGEVTRAVATNLTYRMMLIPVWVAEVQDGRDRKLALINGFTGGISIGETLRMPKRR